MPVGLSKVFSNGFGRLADFARIREERPVIIDAWMQHPNSEWIHNPMFDSLRRWKPGKWSETSQPIEATLAEMDQAGVSTGMLCAWHGPSGSMISNDEVHIIAALILVASQVSHLSISIDRWMACASSVVV